MIDSPAPTIDFNKTVLNEKHLVLWQQWQTMFVLNNAGDKQDIERAERHLQVLKETVRPDRTYILDLENLNRNFQLMLKQAQNEKAIFDLQVDYAIEHYGFLMELLKRRGYCILAKGMLVFDSMDHIYNQDNGTEQERKPIRPVRKTQND